MKNILLFLGGVLLGFALGIGLLIGIGHVNPVGMVAGFFPASTDQIRVGAHAPIFATSTLDNQSVNLQQALGKPVLINFWATWCPPCREEMPLLNDASVKYASELTVIGVNVDEPVSSVQNYISQMKISFPIWMDPGGAISDRYLVDAFPTTFILDKNGIIQILKIGAFTQDELDNDLEKVGVVP
ncbi:MAG: TlpA family protein disulfide reductase [Chloroflexi bacterium]|nr:TlpA family protein disulfide reductase [Chloroflexota bacterium]